MDIVSPSPADPPVSDSSDQPSANNHGVAKIEAREASGSAGTEDMEVDGTMQEARLATKLGPGESAKTEPLGSGGAGAGEGAAEKDTGSSTSA